MTRLRAASASLILPAVSLAAFSLLGCASHRVTQDKDLDKCPPQEFNLNRGSAIEAAMKFLPGIVSDAGFSLASFDTNHPQVCAFLGKACGGGRRKLAFLEFADETGKHRAQLLVTVSDSQTYQFEQGGMALGSIDEMLETYRGGGTVCP